MSHELQSPLLVGYMGTLMNPMDLMKPMLLKDAALCAPSQLGETQLTLSFAGTSAGLDGATKWQRSGNDVGVMGDPSPSLQRFVVSRASGKGLGPGAWMGCV